MHQYAALSTFTRCCANPTLHAPRMKCVLSIASDAVTLRDAALLFILVASLRYRASHE